MPKHIFLSYVCTDQPSRVYHTVPELSTYWSWHVSRKRLCKQVMFFVHCTFVAMAKLTNAERCLVYNYNLRVKTVEFQKIHSHTKSCLIRHIPCHWKRLKWYKLPHWLIQDHLYFLNTVLLAGLLTSDTVVQAISADSPARIKPLSTCQRLSTSKSRTTVPHRTIVF